MAIQCCVYETEMDGHAIRDNYIIICGVKPVVTFDFQLCHRHHIYVRTIPTGLLIKISVILLWSTISVTSS